MTAAPLLHASAVLLALAAGIQISPAAALIAYTAALASEVVLAYFSRPFNLPLTRHLNAPMAVTAVLLGTGAALAAGWVKAIATIALSAFILRLIQTAAYRHPGAVTPVWLGITGLLVEAVTISYIWIGQ